MSTGLLDLTDRSSLVATLPRGGIAAEIGVDTGEFSEVILYNNVPRILYLIDCWECLHDWVGDWNVWPATLRNRYDNVLRRFAAVPAVHVMREWSLIAATIFGNNYFDWIYIDADHYRAKGDIYAWWPKVKPGGWLLGHDYLDESDPVRRAVDGFIDISNLDVRVTGGTHPSWIIQKPEAACT